jgi:hypothetical protein
MRTYDVLLIVDPRLTDEEVARTQQNCLRYLELAQAYVAGHFPPPWTQ